MLNLVLKLENVTTSYKKFRISNINLELNSGDIMGLVGRSGSGKSTILKTLLGIKKQESGNIYLYSEGNMIEIKSVIGYSPQGNSLYPFLTIEENLNIFGKLNGLNKEQIKVRAEYILKRLDLVNSKKKRIIELSGGMQKRADLGVALIHEPNVIILDEPFNGLDISLQRFIWAFLKELANTGRIIIVSSHLLGDIQTYCNQFGLVYNGRFYNTAQIDITLKGSKEKSLEFFLERLFTKDLFSNY